LVEFQVWTVHHWHAFRTLLGDPGELSDSRFDETMYRSQRNDELRPFIASRLAEREPVEVVAEAQRLHIPSAILNQPRDLVRDPHAQERGMFVDMEHPSVGRYQVVRSPFRSQPAISTYRDPSALLGEHNYHMYIDVLGFSEPEIEQWRSGGLI
jgi:crotonobetainyl-CoA:carnitine CoA-transferase CaiB-like acyl-CoA transferase